MTAWRRFVDRVHAEEPVLGLAAFRVVIGLTTAWSLFRIAISGAAAALWYPAAEGGILELQPDSWRWTLLGGASAAATNALIAVAIGASLLVAAGLGTRFAALVAGQALMALFTLVPETGGGHDRLLTNALWLLVFGPSDRSLSLACRWRTGRWVDPTPRPAVVRWLAVVQLCTVYGITGWQKMGPEWWPWGGWTAVYRSLLSPDWARWDLAPWLGTLFPLTQVGTAVTLLWESTFPLVGIWLWARHRREWVGRWDPRIPYVLVGLVMHGTLELATDLGPFAYATLAFYPCLFDAADWRRWTGRPYA